MSVSLETLEGLERRITFSVPAEKVKEEMNKQFNELAKRAKLSGFRPGKVPMRVVEQRYGKEVQEEVLDKLRGTYFREALQQENVKPAGVKRVENLATQPDQEWQFAVIFEVYPQIKLADIATLQVERLVAEVTEQDVEAMLEKVRKQQATWEEVTRPAEQGDRLIIDFTGTQNDVAFAGGSAKDFALVLGSNAFIPGFEDGLLGIKAGESRDLDLTFPENYQAKELAGKPVRFAVTVHKVMQAILPAIDEAFIARFGLEEGGIDALKHEIKSMQQRQLQQVLRDKLKQQVLDQLLEKNPLQVPEVLVSHECERLREQMIAKLKAKKDLRLPAEMFKEQAEKRVKLGLIMAELIEQLALKPDADRVRARLEEIAASYQQPEQVIAWYYSHKEHLQEIEAQVLEEQVVEGILEKAKVVDKTTSFQELIGNQASD